MSAVAIIRNIFQFAKILNNASHETVGQWDNTSIQNALNWADYCTEVYRHVKDWEFEDDVNSQLSQMTMLIEPVSCLRLSLESLMHAKYLLVETLISNPNFPPTSKMVLRSALQRDPDSKVILQQVQAKLSRLHEDSEKCHSLLTVLAREENSTKVNDKLAEEKAKYEAKVLMQHLAYTVGDTKKLDRFQKYCHALCDRLTETQQGWIVLVHCFCADANYLPQEGKVWLDLILSNLLLWVKRKIEQNFDSCPLLNVDCNTLSQASCANKHFFVTYLDILTKWTGLFYPEIHHQHQQASCTWKCPSGHSLETLTQHFMSLLQSLSISQEKTKDVLNVLSDKVKGTDFTAWQFLAEALVHSFRQSPQE